MLVIRESNRQIKTDLKFIPLAISTSSIKHFLPPPPPPPILHKRINYCFQFLLGTCMFPREIENDSLCVYAKFGGQTTCIMGDVEVVNTLILSCAVED